MAENPPDLRCSNPACLGTTMQRIDGLYALTKVEKKNNQLSFHTSTGIPLVTFVCPNCGKIRNYSAKLLNEI